MTSLVGDGRLGWRDDVFVVLLCFDNDDDDDDDDDDHDHAAQNQLHLQVLPPIPAKVWAIFRD